MHTAEPTPVGATASLPMYPLPWLRDATEALWESVRASLPGLAPLEAWGTDTHRLWTDPDLAVSQACGWPLITELAGRVRTVGAFRYRTPGWVGARYRSVVIGRRAGGRPAWPDVRAAVNGRASLSGWVSLCWFAGGGVARAWPGAVTITGSHVASIGVVGSGAADIASIDALTFAYLARDRPDLLAGVEVVGAGPEVPCLPVICAAAVEPAHLADLRAAFADAASCRSEATECLMIDGFTPLDAAAYAPLADLTSAAPAPAG